MDNEINPTDSVTGADSTDVGAAEGNVNDSQVVEKAVSQADDSLSLEEINKTLGRQYTDKVTALNALRETYSHVGKLGQKVSELETKIQTPPTSADVTAQVAEMQRQLAEQNFYSENPEFNTPEAKELIREFGGNPSEVVAKPAFQKAYNAIKTTAEIEKSKSVLHSNPRLGQVVDKITEAREASKNGNDNAAAIAATQAVIEAYGLNE